jgi:hypothetical protein
MVGKRVLCIHSCQGNYLKYILKKYAAECTRRYAAKKQKHFHDGLAQSTNAF